ncbi:MAG: proprotein convertase P-domain-containing protein [Gemmatales bacterium]
MLVPDNNATGITRTFTNPTAGLIEEVVVTLNITQTFRGDMTAFLTSPSGYTSRLFISSGSDNSTAGIAWDFVDNAFWGEQAQGTWSINVRDVAAGDTGTWTSFAISFRMGTIVAIAVPEPATIGFIGLASVGTLGVFWYRRRRQQRLLNTDLSDI